MAKGQLARVLTAALLLCLLGACTQQQEQLPTEEPVELSTGESKLVEKEEGGEDEAEPEDAVYLHTPDELDEIRRSLPYAGEPRVFSPYPTNVYPFYQDELSVQMADYLTHTASVGNLPTESFDSPATAPMDFIIGAAINATPPMSLQYGAEEYRMFYVEQLTVLDQYNDDHSYFYTKEHVAESARVVFGPEVPIYHTGTPLWNYIEYTGVYRSVWLDWYTYDMAVLLDRRDLGDRWELTVVYLRNYAGRWVDLFEHELYPDELADYCRDQLPRHTVTLLKTADGGFTYYAHTLPEQAHTSTYAARLLPKESFSVNDRLAVVLCVDGKPPASSERITQSENLVLDEDGDLIYLFPVFQGTAIAIEQLNWEKGAPAVEDTILYYQPEHPDQYALVLQVKLPPEGDNPAYRIVATMYGERTEYPLVQGAAAADGVFYCHFGAGTLQSFFTWEN